MSQDNNIVKICVVNQDEEILVEVIITTRLVNFWLQVQRKACNAVWRDETVMSRHTGWCGLWA